jgi:DNA-binding MarR family transcriptional regulator
MDEKNDELKIENQICFPLYACSKELVRRYTPFLEKIDLTYTQYIAMMVMWDKKEINVKSLGEILYLDSGTLTPLLKKLEKKGYIQRSRSKEDERNLNLIITKKGMELRKKAKDIPLKISECVNLTEKEALSLYKMLYKILNYFKEN